MLNRRTLLSRLVASSLLLGMSTGFALAAHAQEAAPAVASATPSPDLAGIAHVALRVHDLDASVAFYEKLGYAKAFALSKDGKEYEAFIKINDRQFIELYPATAKDTQIGFLHLCFEGNNLVAAHDYYVAHGLTPKDVRTAGAGNLLFTMPGPATPTGPQNMEYTQYMPGSLHSKDFGLHLSAERIATRLQTVTIASDDPAAARTFYLEKAGFVAGAGTELKLPGGSGESIALVPVDGQGFLSNITLAVADLKAAEQTLKERKVPYSLKGKTITVMDPDNNVILLQVVAGSRR